MAFTAKTEESKSWEVKDPQLYRFVQAEQAMQYESAYHLGSELRATYSHDTWFLTLYGKVCANSNHIAEAANVYKAILEQDPTEFQASYNLGKILLSQGYQEPAIGLFREALTHNKAHLLSMLELQQIYAKQENWSQLVPLIWQSLQLRPEQLSQWQYLFHMRTYIDLHASMPELYMFLEAQLEKGSISDNNVVFVAVDVAMKRSPKLAELFLQIFNHGQHALIKEYDLERLLESVDDPLFHTILKHGLVSLPEFENMIRALRYYLIHAYFTLPDRLAHKTYFPFCITLAHYFFLSEYLPDAEAEEIVWQAELLRKCEAILHENIPLTMEQACAFALLACYQPLDTLEKSETLSEKATALGDDTFSGLIKELCEDLLVEKKLAAEIPSFCDMHDDVSRAVREQYEENPYPRWKKFNTENMLVGNPMRIVQMLYPLHASLKMDIPDNPDMLIAGCGTGQHSLRVATSYPQARILSIDLSSRSLAYAMLKARQTSHINRMEFMQGDILELRNLNRQFHVVESSGVLHHMREPMTGWHILNDCLLPGGIMRIGLYSQSARRSITAVREAIAAQGADESIEDMRMVRRQLMRDKDFNFRLSMDFYTASACRDLLFHRQEHQFTIPMIEQSLKELGLVFLSFSFPLHIMEYYHQSYPKDMRLQTLEHWHKLEEKNPMLFRSMYQFWCYKPIG